VVNGNTERDVIILALVLLMSGSGIFLSIWRLRRLRRESRQEGENRRQGS